MTTAVITLITRSQYFKIQQKRLHSMSLLDSQLCFTHLKAISVYRIAFWPNLIRYIHFFHLCKCTFRETLYALYLCPKHYMRLQPSARWIPEYPFYISNWPGSQNISCWGIVLLGSTQDLCVWDVYTSINTIDFSFLFLLGQRPCGCLCPTFSGSESN